MTSSKQTHIRIYVCTFSTGKEVPASPEQSHYLIHVMRVSNFDRIYIFNEHMGEYEATIRVDKSSAYLRPANCVRLPPTPASEGGPRAPSDACVEGARERWLAFCPIKPHLTHFVVEKATELGVSHILLLSSQRTQHSANVAKLRKVAIEAAEQCNRLTVPVVVHDSVRLEDFAREHPGDHGSTRLDDCALPGENGSTRLDDARALLGDNGSTRLEDARARPWGHIRWFAALERCESAPLLSFKGDDSVGVIIGPEGGFTPEERDLLARHATPVSLGENILRSETAAICALSRLL
ncbi:MAG: 16S rRNA (uracil(1498)-N(3))-methyltransferase [Holosporales bacterium]|nr:16S rRNA (uracil(1498)-N(3))-methyltransferase [Holosporales bacterium]